jgi:hypothetical protein
MANASPQPGNAALSVLQLHFHLLKLSGEIRVVERAEVDEILNGHKNGDISFWKKVDAEMLMRRFLDGQPIPSNHVKETLRDFWTNPHTHVLDQIAFSPLKTPCSTLNYWIGPLVQPQSGSWDLIREYLQNVICDGDKALYHYLIQFLAHMVQRPEEKPGVMIIFLGRQGTGKGMFFQLLSKLWPRTTLVVSDIAQVVGQFNAALERNFAICMDEAIFSGDKKSQDRLKSLVTEKTLRIEQKYQPSRTIDSVHRIFAASNHEHFSRIEGDDRRSLFIRVSTSRQNDHGYFAQLSAALNDKTVIGAMLHDLMQIDLSSFNVRSRPLTQEHDKQKMLSLTGFNRYWYEVLCVGKFMQLHTYSPSLFEKDWIHGDFVSSDSLMQGFKAFDRNSERYETVQAAQVTNALKRLCPSLKNDRATVAGKQLRGFKLPPLDVARSEFESVFSVQLEWEEA